MQAKRHDEVFSSRALLGVAVPLCFFRCSIALQGFRHPVQRLKSVRGVVDALIE